MSSYKGDSRRGKGLTIFENRIQSVCSGLGITVTKEEIKDIATVLVDIWSEYLSPDPDCIPVLEMLKKDKILALISNFDHPPYVYDTVTRTGLAEYFNTIIVSGDVGINKPDPEIYHLALRRTRLRPEEVVYIGDTGEDVEGSLSAGMTPILVQRKIDDTSIINQYTQDRNPVVPSLPDIERLTDIKIISGLPELIDILN
jgi:HAD superfamily hydrolase (TIGR01509 family)